MPQTKHLLKGYCKLEMAFTLRTFTLDDYEQIVELWQKTNLHVGPSETREGLLHKLEHYPELFIVAVEDDRIVGSVVGGYDGRRGWANKVAVDPVMQGSGLGRQLMNELEDRLRAIGCQKLNLMVARSNAHVQHFYERLGFEESNVIFMEKWL